MAYWGTGYDWRRVEARLNALPQFMPQIDGQDIQFAITGVRREQPVGESRASLQWTPWSGDVYGASLVLWASP